MEESCHCKRKKKRSPREERLLKNRLNRIAGQIRALQKMVEEDAYCPDILTQVSAVSAALNSFSRELLAEHVRTCVTEGVRAGDQQVVDELVNTLQKMMK